MAVVMQPRAEVSLREFRMMRNGRAPDCHSSPGGNAWVCCDVRVGAEGHVAGVHCPTSVTWWVCTLGHTASPLWVSAFSSVKWGLQVIVTL